MKPKKENKKFKDKGLKILSEILSNQEEIISSPIRFNGVRIKKIKEVFERFGIVQDELF